MAVKEHYDNHLGKYYSWMAGDFTEKRVEHQQNRLRQSETCVDSENQ
jgi:hypothetical protein